MAADRVPPLRMGASGRRRAAWFAGGAALLVLTVWLADRVGVSDLSVLLLIVLAEVLVIGAKSGPFLAATSAVGAVLLVNWFLVAPYHTFHIANADNLVTLVVFVAVAVLSSLLVEWSGRARAHAAVSQQQAELLGRVARSNAEQGSEDALRKIAQALDLSGIALLSGAADGATTLVSVGEWDPSDTRTFDVSVAGGFRLVAHGQQRVGADPKFLASLAAGVVRAYESEQLSKQRQQVAELAGLDRARAALLASVGHDLRTPLAGLRVAVDALRSGTALSEDDRSELLETIDASAGRLDELITNLLDMSRLEAGAVIAHPEACGVDEIVARALLSIEHSDAVDVDVPDLLPQVRVDPALLERIIANLVSNAQRHGASSRPTEVLARASSDAVVVEVVDHGAGMDQPREDGIPPRRLNAGHADGGFGLGLEIVRGFAAAMALAINFRVTPGGGLTAQLRLPLADAVVVGAQGPRT